MPSTKTRDQLFVMSAAGELLFDKNRSAQAKAQMQSHLHTNITASSDLNISMLTVRNWFTAIYLLMRVKRGRITAHVM
jgi:hypothetical protein